MKSNGKKVMILSPAGSFEALAAAIQAGADAIYFGVEQLNMRARAADYFTLKDLVEIAGQCKGSNVKAYLALNTVLYDYDMQLMRRIILSAKKSGIDAVIASDHAAMNYAKSIGMPIHISTQANVSNIEAVRFFSGFADVIVLARELSLKQIAEITREIKRKNILGPSGNLIKIEVFAHGALCMAISGMCYLSLHSHFASANRGACLQNCRRPYVVTDKEVGIEFEIDNEYIMSAKDLCTIDILDQIINAGISVLKIEGRGRAADYVSVVTKCYRQAVDAINDGQYNSEKIAQWQGEMSKVYNRGFWKGYYLGQQLGEWVNQPGSAATEKKIYIGKGNCYYPKIGVGEFVLEAGSIAIGDTLMVIGRSEGVHKERLTELRINGVGSLNAKKGDVVSLPWTGKVSKNDKLYKILDEKSA